MSIGVELLILGVICLIGVAVQILPELFILIGIVIMCAGIIVTSTYETRLESKIKNLENKVKELEKRR